MGGANKYFCWMHAFPCPRHKNWLNHVKNSCLVSSRWTFSSFSLTFLSFFFFFDCTHKNTILHKNNCRKGKKKKRFRKRKAIIFLDQFSFHSFSTFNNAYILWKSFKLVVAPCLHISFRALLLLKLFRQVFFHGTVT